jgi:membrane protease YdiL (CAAX protease family)
MATRFSGAGFVFAVLFMVILNILSAFAVQMAVEAAQRTEMERQGKIVVSRVFLLSVKEAQAHWSGSREASDASLSFEGAYSREARTKADREGGSRTEIELRLRSAMRLHGTADFVTYAEASPGIKALVRSGPLAAMLGSVMLLWWAVMLVFQGEGLELDLQRRRHPMWEWLFSHPAPPSAIFLAEMLSPIAANPIYWAGPLFAGFVFGFAYGPALGVLALILVGVPLTVAAACLGKALEIGVILRFSPRSRGAMMGFMSWIGYASMMLLFVGVFVIPKMVTAMARPLAILTRAPWPWLGWFLGARADGSFSFVTGVLICWVAAGVTIAGSVGFSVWGAQQGLAGNFASSGRAPSAARAKRTGTRPPFQRDPLYRKEFLWFARDRSAIVQTILIPLTVAGIQMFNLRGVLSHAQGAWNYICGAGIFFGTYFLWILGPRSLQSEGQALWIALTWPRGMEDLLKAKAWLWSMISSALVALVLAYACFVFPHEIWKIGLVGFGWFIFSRSMAEKSVTLVTVTPASGEAEKIPWGRRWAAQLGMLTFAIGVLTEQWHIAIMGIVYSYVTAAAMWESFRARLPYLYDPWSERVPPPPTLMHAMISISILVEGGAVITGIVQVVAGRQNVAMAQAIGYAVCALIVSVCVVSFLRNRHVTLRDVVVWKAKSRIVRDHHPSGRRLGLDDLNTPVALLTGACGGLALGLLAHVYLAALEHFPAAAELVRNAHEQMTRIPDLRIWYAVMAVGFAPFAEEYLFRGLLYRALDREWGGWRAVIGSAAFFAIYHPPLSWLPVALLGAANAVLFKKTGRLAPAIALHMVYNAVALM